MLLSSSASGEDARAARDVGQEVTDTLGLSARDDEVTRYTTLMCDKLHCAVLYYTVCKSSLVPSPSAG